MPEPQPPTSYPGYEVGPGPAAPWGEPSWAGAVWAPPAAPAPVAVPAAVGRRRWLPLALAGAGGVVLGAVGGAFLVGALLLAGARDIGEEIGTSIGDGLARSFGDAMTGPLPSEGLDPYATGPVDRSSPVTPVPGPDPVLDSYAQNCFSGDMQACDDLYYESPPLSDYEQYAVTCAGRVKQYAVAACTDLD